MLDRIKGKKLYRNPADAILFGVAAGLAEYLQVDVVFVRLVVVLLAILTHGWPVLVAYVAAVILVPIHPAQETVASDQSPKDVTPRHEAKPEPASEPEPEQKAPPETNEPETPTERMDSDQNM